MPRQNELLLADPPACKTCGKPVIDGITWQNGADTAHYCDEACARRDGRYPVDVSETYQQALWAECVRIATKNGRAEADVRRQIGSMLKAFEGRVVLKALRDAQNKQDPLTYARKILRGANKGAWQEFINGGE